MRWIFVTLLLLNLLVFGVLWQKTSTQGVSAPVVEEALTASGKRIAMLGERIEPERVPDSPGLRSPSSPPASAVIPRDGSARAGDAVCPAVGPALNETDAQRLIAALKSFGLEVRLVEREVERAPDYWVYLAPYESREEAVTVLRELQQVRRIDSFLISQGPLANGISLGLFKNREAAVALQLQRLEQGLAAKLAEVERRGAEFWAVFSQEVTAEELSSIPNILAAEKIDAELQHIYCKSVASPEKVP